MMEIGPDELAIPKYLKSIAESLQIIANVQTRLMAVTEKRSKVQDEMQEKMKAMLKNPPLEK